MDLLQRFNGDVHTKEALMEFIHDHIDKSALQRMYKGEDVYHVKDAMDLINGAFEDLNNKYGFKDPPTQQENIAR